MKVVAAILCLHISLCLFSQQKNTTEDQNQINTSETQSVYQISGDEIRHFPSLNFLDAVNGLFPGVFGQNTDPNNFLFVIDGFILPDINGLSLYDIDKVVYTRNSLNGKLYPFSKAGTFYITTRNLKNKKFAIELNSQYNYAWNKNGLIFNRSDRSNPPPGEIDHSENQPGYFTSNHLSIAAAGNKFHFYSSVQYDELKKPALRQHDILEYPLANDTLVGNFSAKQNNLRTLLKMGYNFSSKLQAGITGNYVINHGKLYLNSETHYPASTNTVTTSSPSRINYYQAGGFLNWHPLHNLHNHLSFELSEKKYTDNQVSHIDNYLFQSPEFKSTIYNDNKVSLNRYILRNQLDYDVLTRGKFTGGVGTTFSYTDNKFSQLQLGAQYQNNSTNPTSTSGSSSWYKEKITVLNPRIYFNYDSIVSGYAGYGFLLNKGFTPYASSSKSNPYANLLLDIHKAAGISGKLSSLLLSFNYGDLSKNQSTMYWLGADDKVNLTVPTNAIGPVYTSIVGVNFLPNPREILKNRLIAFSLQTGFMQDRLIADIEWSSLKIQDMYSLPDPSNPPNFTYRRGDNIQKTFSVYLLARFVEKTSASWSSRFNILFASIRDTIPGVIIYSSDQIKYLYYKTQIGWQNNFQFKNWSLLVNSSFGTGLTYYSRRTLDTKKKLNEFSIPILRVGYNFPTGKSNVFEHLGLFLQARNLVISKKAKDYYQYDRFAGIGLDIRLK